MNKQIYTFLLFQPSPPRGLLLRPTHFALYELLTLSQLQKKNIEIKDNYSLNFTQYLRKIFSAKNVSQSSSSQQSSRVTEENELIGFAI